MRLVIALLSAVGAARLILFVLDPAMPMLVAITMIYLMHGDPVRPPPLPSQATFEFELAIGLRRIEGGPEERQTKRQSITLEHKDWRPNVPIQDLQWTLSGEPVAIPIDAAVYQSGSGDSFARLIAESCLTLGLPRRTSPPLESYADLLALIGNQALRCKVDDPRDFVTATPAQRYATSSHMVLDENVRVAFVSINSRSKRQ